MSDRILERAAIALERFVTAINDSRPDASRDRRSRVALEPQPGAFLPGTRSRI